mgnify:CR=1 FL=1|tara:strand:+ start:8755 stop:9249 length:495 start_codon:yes stop_codon:yes gene_type:complete
MKKNIILYLFLFTALILIFQLVNSKKVFENLEAKLTATKLLNEVLKDSVFKVKTQLEEQNDFILEGNEYALRYFENLNIENIESYVKDVLYDTNLMREKNELIPYAAMNRTYLINKIKVLNHKWIVADFSDGTYWGEIFLTYKINKGGKVSFELKEHFLYPNAD